MFDIKIFNDSATKFLPKQKLAEAVGRVLKDKKIKKASINVILVDDDIIKSMNSQYLTHDYPTDVISFNIDDDPVLLGEIYISVDTAKRQAEEFKVSLTNELKRLAIHGTLHLIGYEDDTIKQKKEMHNLENKYIS